MFTDGEREEVQTMVWAEMASVEHRVEHDAGSFPYLCLVAGHPTFCHYAAGPVLRYLPPPMPDYDCGLGL